MVSLELLFHIFNHARFLIDNKDKKFIENFFSDFIKINDQNESYSVCYQKLIYFFNDEKNKLKFKIKGLPKELKSEYESNLRILTEEIFKNTDELYNDLCNYIPKEIK